MLELLGGVLGAGASVAGALINAEEQAQTRDMNWAIAIMNYQQRERERAEAIAMALKQQREQKLGTTDIRGTRTHFIPGRGWVTEGSPQVMAMIKARDEEEGRQLQDMAMKRKVQQRNYMRGLQEEGIADTYRRKLAGVYQRGDEGYASDLYQAMAMGLREASGDMGRRAWSQAFRTGQNSNFDELAASLARENNKAYMNAALQAKLMSRGAGLAEAQGKRKEYANLYNMFATRAGQVPDVSYRPQQLETGTLAQSTAQDLQAGQLATQMFAKKGGELDYLSPLTGVGNAIAGGGAALASAFRAQGARNAYNPQQQGSGLTFGATGNTSSYDGGGGMYAGSENYIF